MELPYNVCVGEMTPIDTLGYQIKAQGQAFFELQASGVLWNSSYYRQSPLLLITLQNLPPIVEDATHLSYRTWGNQTAADVEASGLWTSIHKLGSACYQRRKESLTSLSCEHCELQQQVAWQGMLTGTTVAPMLWCGTTTF